MNGIEDYRPAHFGWRLHGAVATITLDRPERKNPLTFGGYEELRDTFRRVRESDQIRAVVITGAGGNFSSGGDVHEIIGPLLEMPAPQLLAFTRLASDLVRAIRDSPQPVIAAIEGICAGAGACIAMASDLRVGACDCRVAFLFTRVGLAGADMGACAMLPRLIGFSRASELLFTGRTLFDQEALAWGFLNRLVEQGKALEEAQSLAAELSEGPAFAHRITKMMLKQEWSMALDDALDAEAISQALCMKTADFRRAYEAFSSRETPRFEGN